jgi:hypothetical protein
MPTGMVTVSPATGFVPPQVAGSDHGKGIAEKAGGLAGAHMGGEAFQSSCAVGIGSVFFEKSLKSNAARQVKAAQVKHVSNNVKKEKRLILIRLI